MFQQQDRCVRAPHCIGEWTPRFRSNKKRRSALAETASTEQAKYAWSFWSIDWPNATAGEHTITSRAADAQGNLQPAMDEPRITRKKTYWESNGQAACRIQIA